MFALPPSDVVSTRVAVAPQLGRAGKLLVNPAQLRPLLLAHPLVRVTQSRNIGVCYRTRCRIRDAGCDGSGIWEFAFSLHVGGNRLVIGVTNLFERRQAFRLFANQSRS